MHENTRAMCSKDMSSYSKFINSQPRSTVDNVSRCSSNAVHIVVWCSEEKKAVHWLNETQRGRRVRTCMPTSTRSCAGAQEAGLPCQTGGGGEPDVAWAPLRGRAEQRGRGLGRSGTVAVVGHRKGRSNGGRAGGVQSKAGNTQSWPS